MDTEAFRKTAKELANKIADANARGDILGVLLLDESASHAAVNKAYRKLAKMLHQDKIGDDQLYREAFYAVKAAHDKLQDAAEFAQIVANRRRSSTTSSSAVFDALFGNGTGQQQQKSQPIRPSFSPPSNAAWWQTPRATAPPPMPETAAGLMADMFGSPFVTNPGVKRTYAELFGKDHPKTKAREAEERAKAQARVFRTAPAYGKRKRAARAYSADASSAPPPARRRRTTTKKPAPRQETLWDAIKRGHR